MRIFLAAPMTGWKDSPASHTCTTLKSFITDLSGILRRNGHDVFSAHDVERFGEKPRHESICTPFDFLEVRRADLLIAFPSRSGGVHTEIGWASTLQKPIILLSSGDESPLARGLSALTQVEALPVSRAFPNDMQERKEVLLAVLKRISNFFQMKQVPHIAFVATAFGFGPTAKAIAIAQEYRIHRPDDFIDFFGAGIDYDLAEKSGLFDQLIRFDVDDPALSSDLANHLSMYDDVISIMNFLLADAWDPEIRKLHVVDSLAWMWPHPPQGVENATNYFIQTYLVNESRLKSWNEDLPVRPVGPICRAFPSSTALSDPNERLLLVNFSGCANPLIDGDIYRDYAILFSSLIAKNVGGLFEKIIVCSQSSIADTVRKEVVFPCESRIGHLSPDDFAQALVSADRILTSPGITATIEALALGKGPFFLLPQNYSQALIIERNMELYPEQTSMAFSQLGPEFAVPEGLPEGEGVRLVEHHLRRILHEKQEWLRDRINRMLIADTVSLPRLSTERGQKTIVETILELRDKPKAVSISMVGDKP